ncbi:cyclin-D1-1-like [Rutidosis leptorrhynchoides]|uniref:cyclin-D1-1-like n=1 Tax=Rutidosis leptorrhynchoides TaxID=125765 RepID=UPI003A98FE67
MSDHSTRSLFFSAAVDHLSPSIVDSLISDESLLPDYVNRCQRHLTHRQDSINWILNAHAFYVFRPITAILSVNYLDRFLSSTTDFFEWNKGWEYQLLSVACLSLAAKMEEVEVPLLFDLQVSEPRYVFESKTIQKMELLVMSTLNFRLRSVTPFDFLHYFISVLPTSFCTDKRHFNCKCSDLIIKTLLVIDFLRFRPSVIAAAAVKSVAGEGVEIPESYYEKVNKEMVRSCHQLMQEYLVDTCPSAENHNTRKRYWRSDDEPPASPDGVLEAATCVSCDTPHDRILVPATLLEDRGAKRVMVNVQEDKP